MTSEELYASFKNSLGVADTATEKILARRQGQAGATDIQALEEPAILRSIFLAGGMGSILWSMRYMVWIRT